MLHNLWWQQIWHTKSNKLVKQLMPFVCIALWFYEINESSFDKIISIGIHQFILHYCPTRIPIFITFKLLNPWKVQFHSPSRLGLWCPILKLEGDVESPMHDLRLAVCEESFGITDDLNWWLCLGDLSFGLVLFLNWTWGFKSWKIPWSEFRLDRVFLGFLTIYIDHLMKWIKIGQMDQNKLYRTVCINDGLRLTPFSCKSIIMSPIM